ncbi:MAG: DNA cytosine methyltransferase [Flavobacterium sp.]|nr:DNA cytosine methyltransferase [Flavobacterium sp.]
MDTNKSLYIDLFAGCGGLSLGLYNSGLWKGLFAVEKNADAFKTLEHNLIKNNNHFVWPDWLPTKEHDINDVLKNFNAQLRGLRGQVDLVAGGPPCQGFSTAGKRLETDERNKLIKSYISFIRLVQPKMIFFENVKGFTQKFDKNKSKGKAYSEYVLKALRTATGDFPGYDVYGKLVDFSLYGIPQKRTRFILVGIKKGSLNKNRAKSFFNALIANKESFLLSKNIGITNNLEHAISDLLREGKEVQSPDTKSFKAGMYGVAESNYQKLLRIGVNEAKIPDSHRFAKHTKPTLQKFEYILRHAEKNKTLSVEIKEMFDLKKRTVIPLSGLTPTATITTLPDDYIHYSEPRIFTVREYARIQSFNDWYEFKGKYTTGGKRRTQEVPRYSQIGNAIPPLFGEQSGLILKQLIG